MHCTFEELCGRPLAAADYIALAEARHTLCLGGVPVFTGATRSEAYRFVTLIDVLYEHRRVLVSSLFVGIILGQAARVLELQSPTEQQRPPTLGIRAPLHPALPTPTAGCALRLAQRICLLSDLPPLWPFPLHRVRTVLAAEALPFELFRNIKTQEEARQERAEGRAGLDDVVDDNLG